MTMSRLLKWESAKALGSPSAPCQEIRDAIGHGRQELQQHDRFSEMVEIIGGKPGHRIDIGSAATRCDWGGGRCGGVDRAIGGRRGHGNCSVRKCGSAVLPYP